MTYKLHVLDKELSYEQIVNDITERVPETKPVEEQWDYHVSAAKTLLLAAYFNRMAIAEIAIRATIIKSGGDRHSEDFKNVLSQLSLSAFANASGINPATLWLWVSIKTTVFNVLPEDDRRDFSHDAGEKTTKTLGVKRRYPQEIVAETYDRFRRLTKSQKATLRLFKLIMAVKKYFTRTDFWQELSDEQLDKLRTSLAQILKRVVDIQSMRSKAPNRKSRAKKRAAE